MGAGSVLQAPLNRGERRVCFKLPWCVPCSRLGEHLLKPKDGGGVLNSLMPWVREALGGFLGFFFFLNVS